MQLTVRQLRRLITEADFSVLFESKVDDLQVKYSTLDVKEIAKHDPSGSAAKYLGWMLKQLAKGHSTSDLYPSIDFFHKNISRFPQKDLNAYSDLKDLESAVKSLPTKSKTQTKKQVKSEEAAKIYEDDQQVVVRPDSKKACIAYGGNTKWCITMGDASYYEEYTSQNVVFYFVISKNLDQADPMAKVALAVLRDDDNAVIGVDYYDAVDDQLTEADCEQRIDRFVDILRKVKADAATRPMGLLAKIKSGKATADEIRQNFKDSDVKFRELLAQSKNVPVDVLTQLAVDKDLVVRSYVAGNPSTPADILMQLAKDEDDGIKREVACNPSTLGDVLKQLAMDDDGDVRWWVAQNPSTPEDVLTRLAADTDKSIRLCVALNSSTPGDALKQLAKDKDDDNIRMNVARNQSTSVDVLKQLTADTDPTVRACVACNPLTPVDVLGQLATDEDKYVRRCVALNSSTPGDVLKLLATTDKGDNVRQSAKRNLNSRNQHENTLMMTMNQLRRLLSEVTVSDDCWGGVDYNPQRLTTKN